MLRAEEEEEDRVEAPEEARAARPVEHWVEPQVKRAAHQAKPVVLRVKQAVLIIEAMPRNRVCLQGWKEGINFLPD